MCIITLNEDEEGGRRPGNGREGREAAMEGRAAAVRGAVAGVLGDGRERERRLGRFAARAAGLAATEGIPGFAAPWIMAWHCRAKIGGAAEPCHVSGQRFWSPLRQLLVARHLAAPGQ